MSAKSHLRLAESQASAAAFVGQQLVCAQPGARMGFLAPSASSALARWAADSALQQLKGQHISDRSCVAPDNSVPAAALAGQQLIGAQPDAKRVLSASSSAQRSGLCTKASYPPASSLHKFTWAKLHARARMHASAPDKKRRSVQRRRHRRSAPAEAQGGLVFLVLAGGHALCARCQAVPAPQTW